MFSGSRLLAHSRLASCGVSYPDTTEINVKIKNLPPFGGASMFREGGAIAVRSEGLSKVSLGASLRLFVGFLHITRPYEAMILNDTGVPCPFAWESENQTFTSRSEDRPGLASFLPEI